jgi:hypothetical protein
MSHDKNKMAEAAARTIAIDQLNFDQFSKFCSSRGRPRKGFPFPKTAKY